MKNISIAVCPNLRYTDKSLGLFANPNSCWYIDVLAATLYYIMTDLYHDNNPIYRRYSWKDISIAVCPNLRYTNKSLNLTQKSDRLLVYRCISHYCIFYHDRPLSWSNPMYRSCQWRHISIAVCPNLRYTNKSLGLFANPNLVWLIVYLLLLYILSR